MKKILTIKGFDNLTELEYNGEANDMTDIYSMSIISGLSNDKLKKMKPSVYSAFKHQLLSQVAQTTSPAYLIKYKGVIYGYHPCELGTVEDMAAMELFSKEKKWQALVALIFRPVKAMSRWAHRKENKFEDLLGIKVKKINDYKKDCLKYTTKDIDFSKIDLSIFDEFPFQILMSNLGFLVGSGVQFSLNIHPSSLKSPKIRKEIRILQQNLQQVINGLVWQKVLPQLTFLNSTVEGEHLTSAQEKLVTTSLSSSTKSTIAQLRERVSEDAWVVTGDFNKGLLNSVITLWESLLNQKNLSMNQLSQMHGLMKANNYKNRLEWLSLT